MEPYCFIDGEVLPLSSAKVSVLDIGLLRGYGIYDGLAVIKGRVLDFKDHWQRFKRGADALALKIPVTSEFLEEKILEIAERSGLSARANVRLILTGGQTIEGIDYDKSKPTFYALVEKWEPLPKKCFDRGAKLISYDYQRELPEIKTINYISAVNLQARRKKEGALDILYTHKGRVLECATSNIFLVKNKVLISPNVSVLEGITAKIVMKLAKEHYKIEEREVSEGELKTADEVFITSSFKDVVPISNMDDWSVASGQPGPVTRDIMDRFAEYIK